MTELDIKGCENCQRCFSDCKKPFPEEYDEGGADKCKKFLEESDNQIVFSNITKRMDAMRDAEAKYNRYF